jgi:hypothetical protein
MWAMAASTSSSRVAKWYSMAPRVRPAASAITALVAA